MWDVDNDRYRLRRLEYELPANRINRLLNNVTTTDRMPFHISGKFVLRAARSAARSCCKWLYSLFSAPTMVRRAPE